MVKLNRYQKRSFREKLALSYVLRGVEGKTGHPQRLRKVSEDAAGVLGAFFEGVEGAHGFG